MKLTIIATAFAACLFINPKAQAFLGIGTGTDGFETWIVNIQAGYRFKYIVPELEIKAPPVSRLLKVPAIFCAKAGYPINLGHRLMLLPQFLYSYQYHSADQPKGDTWENGFRAGIGCRLRYRHVFVQADYLGETYLSIGIASLLRETRRK